MNITTILQKRLTKQETEHLAKEIDANKKIFKEIWQLSIAQDEFLSPRAAWLLDYITMEQPQLLKPYLAKAVKEFGNITHHNSIHRNLGKALLRVEIPEDLQGDLYDICVKHLLSPPIAIAIKVHAMELATRIALPYVELRQELITIVEDVIEDGSGGIISRGKKMLKVLKAN